MTSIKINKMLKVRQVFKTRNAIALMASIFGGLSILAGILTFYGKNAGNLVINTTEESYSKGIELSETSSFLVTAPSLFAEAAKDVSPFYYNMLPNNYIRNTDGNYKTDKGQYFLGYTFYLRNASNEMLNISYKMLLQDVTKNADSAIRVWLFEDDTDESGTMYLKEEIEDGHYSNNHGYVLPPQQFFLNEKTVFERTITELNKDQVKKFTLIIWFEDADYDCVNYGENSIAGGGVKLAMYFNVTQIIKNE